MNIDNNEPLRKGRGKYKYYSNEQYKQHELNLLRKRAKAFYIKNKEALRNTANLYYQMNKDKIKERRDKKKAELLKDTTYIKRSKGRPLKYI